MFTSTKNKSYRDSFSYRAVTIPTTPYHTISNLSRKKSANIVTYISVRLPSLLPISSDHTDITRPPNSALNSAIVTISVGPSQRLFAAHEDVLRRSDYFASACRARFFDSPGNKRIELPTEEPEVFSAVLEFLYKGDYTPKIAYDKKRATWYLEDDETGVLPSESVIHVGGTGGAVLKDTAIYCSAYRYALPDLQRLALKKQGLQSGVSCSTILSSGRFAYAHTPASDCKLRAHYLALIIRSRSTFKRSGTMQAEMQQGGSPLFFDLFVAMVNHLDDIAAAKSPH